MACRADRRGSGRLVIVHSEPRALFLFGDGGLNVELSIERAVSSMEPIDVGNGVYEAVFDESGRCYDFSVVNETTQLQATDVLDIEGLRDRLRAQGQAMHSLEGVDLDDPMVIAEAISRLEWERRWPRWPKWLSRRLHGDGPAIVK